MPTHAEHLRVAGERLVELLDEIAEDSSVGPVASAIRAWDRACDNPLTAHHLDLALSGVFSSTFVPWKPTDAAAVRAELEEGGFGQSQIEQVVTAWKQRWPKCTACGEHATHYYGTMDQQGHVHSMSGEGVLAPSCNGCDDPEVDRDLGSGVAIIRTTDLRFPQRIGAQR